MQTLEIVNAVQSAVTEVFSSMLGIEVVPSPFVVDSTGRRGTDGVMSFVSLAGPWVGSGLLSCSSSFACHLCSLFLMQESEHVDGDVLDAIGEIANMVVGNFKTTAEAKVGALALSIPTTVYGKTFGFKSLGCNEWLVIPFKYEKDTFEVWIWFAPAPESQMHRHASIQLHAVAPGCQA